MNACDDFECYTRQEVARKAKVHVRTIDNWEEHGLITRLDLPLRGVRYSKTDVMKLLDPRNPALKTSAARRRRIG